MKKLPIENPAHRRLELAFKEWLALTGYAATGVYSMPLQVREFLHYLERENKPLESLISKDIHSYFSFLERRKKQRRQGAISINYLHKHLQSIRLLSRYLRETGQVSFDTDIVLAGQKSKLPEVLAREEIRQLYEACAHTPIGLRDRAMLSICYGCGLRRNEAVSLDATDFLQDKNLLYIRKGKGYKERYVPMTGEVKTDLQNYLGHGRYAYLRNLAEPALLISERGRRIQGQSLMLRLKQLAEKAGINKNAGLHTLRHSIATHLLQSGMGLQSIAKFLGHESLESTQIYTHVAAEAEGEGDRGRRSSGRA